MAAREERRWEKGEIRKSRAQRAQDRGQSESVITSHSPATPGRREGGSLVSPFIPHPSFFILLLVWLLLIEFASAAWYRAHERNLVASTGWDVQWPRNAPRFHEIKIDEDARRILRFDRGYAASWIAAGPESQAHLGPMICSAFFLCWEPGRNSALLANLHRPDVCLPSV